MQLRDGRKTEELARALAAAIGASSADVQTCQMMTADSEAGPDAANACLLVTSPHTLAEAEGWLAGGRADAVLVWSDERLAPGPGVAVMAEQRFGDDWVSVTRRAAPVTDAVVLQLRPRTPTPLEVPGASPVVLVWRGLDEAAVDAAMAEVDARPYAARARMVFVPDTAPAFSLSAPLYTDQLARGARVSVLAQDGSWGCWRTLPLAEPLCAALSATRLDDVDLQFLAANPITAGLAGPVDYVGVEGASVAGRRVMGVARWLGDDRRPQPDPLLRWPVPQGWAPEDAVTVPYVHAVAYHSLLVKAQARRGESILVHEGTKAFGQAAIRVAAQLGCSPIYTTVRSAEERDALRRIFTQLEPCHVLMCGDGGSFEYRIRVLTRNRGVKIIVNTLAGSELQASIRCLSVSGRLLHYNREDALAGRSIGECHGDRGEASYDGEVNDTNTVNNVRFCA
ncbi:hypothetical protein ONE63_003612 [Megalurothrips usitatus]|uniref:Enoyl reductase (ER) domain-containing protein n=1 Tax=Megalurothrips usitatus TaxID=439358 RepID=A0AAV7X7G8_9NEOP|nr:hypothetical protein ONE63_003612 [Megalurothrips usitatus]